MDDVICPMCGRELGEISIDRHHLIPKTFGGRETVNLHKICHRTIHATFTERELANYFYTIARLHENEHIRSFVKWVKNKRPDFYDTTAETGRRKKKRSR